MAAHVISNTRADLEAQGKAIVQRLGGQWRPNGGMCRCPAHDDRDPSLSVRVGSTSLLFKCFAGCDGVDVIRAIRDQRILDVDYIRSRPPSDDGPASDERRTRKALQIWDAARPIKGSPALRYLQERGLSSASPDLRYLARTPCGVGASATFRPAMIAAVRDSRGFVSIQRTFLERHRPAKASDLEKAKMALGTPGRGAVRLFKAKGVLGIAEGIETALAAHIMLGIPVWAVLGTERFPLIELPDEVTDLVLLPDPGGAGERAAALAFDAHQRPGRTITTEWPRLGDWNDDLLAHLAPA